MSSSGIETTVRNPDSGVQLLTCGKLIHPPGEWVDEEGDDDGGGERAGEVDTGQDVEAGPGDYGVVVAVGSGGAGRVAAVVQGGEIDPGAVVGAAHFPQLVDVDLLRVLMDNCGPEKIVHCRPLTGATNNGSG